MEKPGDTFKCYLVSWEEAYRLAKILSRKIKSSGFEPDLVIGIARGGLVPARIVCDFLLQKDLAAIKVEHWGIAATLGKAKIKFPLPIDISGKKILIVDDVADTGDTFSVIMDYIKEKAPSEVKTAVLHYKTCSTSVPDYWAERQDEWKWIIYPWAVYEDLTGFIKKVLTKPMTDEAIRKALKSGFDIKISKKDLLEMLNDMQAAGEIRKIKKGIQKNLWTS
ncbi:MAG: phosphoribosyltransferase [Euryarchaeota archaeon]|nr:phosphoribosyltransferase [Euryarchaeota archaeon]MCG2727490.1 phosphoribosyltransferase [Candidatus Methanoperedenaceae archaeon]